MSDITYKLILSGKKKRIEVFADQDKYAKALRLIGCRRGLNFDGWTITSENEQSLIDLINKLGGDANNQKTIVDGKADKASKKEVKEEKGEIVKRKYTKKTDKKEEFEEVKENKIEEIKETKPIEFVSSKKESTSKPVSSSISSFLSKKPKYTQPDLSENESDKYHSEAESDKRSPFSISEMSEMSSKESDQSDKLESHSEDSQKSEKSKHSEHSDHSDHSDHSESEQSESEDSPSPPKKKFTPPQKYRQNKEVREKPKEERYSKEDKYTSKHRDMRDIRDYKKRDKDRDEPKDNYIIKYNQDKIRYYQKLGKKHTIDHIEDTSTEYESSSDDFPTPPKRKYDSEKESLQKRIQELEKMIKRK